MNRGAARNTLILLALTLGAVGVRLTLARSLGSSNASNLVHARVREVRGGQADAAMEVYASVRGNEAAALIVADRAGQLLMPPVFLDRVPGDAQQRRTVLSRPALRLYGGAFVSRIFVGSHADLERLLESDAKGTKAEVVAALQRRVHAGAATWGDPVGGVAGQEHRPGAEPVGDLRG